MILIKANPLSCFLVLSLLYSTICVRDILFTFPLLATIFTSVDNLNQVMAVLEQLQLENEILQESLRELQSGTSRDPPPVESHPLSTRSPTTSSSHPYVLEPTVSLPDKFNGTRAYLRGFINQIRLIIRLQPLQYASDVSRVGLVGFLLSRPTQAWFAPLVETSSPLLENFTAFIVELEATFGYERHSRSSIPSNKAHIQPLSTLQSSVRLPTMSIGMTKLYTTIFVACSATMSRLSS